MLDFADTFYCANNVPISTEHQKLVYCYNTNYHIKPNLSFVKTEMLDTKRR